MLFKDKKLTADKLKSLSIEELDSYLDEIDNMTDKELKKLGGREHVADLIMDEALDRYNDRKNKLK